MAFEFFSVEEQFLDHGFQDEDKKDKSIEALDLRLSDKMTARLPTPRAAQIAFRILSHPPRDHVPTIKQARKANEKMANVVRKNPSRYVAFAQIPMEEPKAAVEILRHAVKTQGFRGALLPSTFPEEDDNALYPVFAEAERLDVPIYLNPAKRSKKDFSDSMNFLTNLLTTSCAQILHLFTLGIFDTFPGLKFLISDMDSMTPYILLQILASEQPLRARSLAQVWESNVWVSTSNLMSLPALECLLKIVPSGHVIYRADDEEEEEEMEFVERIRMGGILRGEELEGFWFGNAERLLGVRNCVDVRGKSKVLE